jgi:hypothetical protein
LATWFRAGTQIVTREDGSVSQGTLLNKTNLYTNPQHSQARWFDAGATVNFGPDGSVN